MTEFEKQELLLELEILEVLLNFHTDNKTRVSMSEKEFEDYVDTALDRINEIRNLLNASS
jgi:ribosome assembly protein YihI (activator of Der GTPase)